MHANCAIAAAPAFHEEIQIATRADAASPRINALGRNGADALEVYCTVETLARFRFSMCKHTNREAYSSKTA